MAHLPKNGTFEWHLPINGTFAQKCTHLIFMKISLGLLFCWKIWYWNPVQLCHQNSRQNSSWLPILQECDSKCEQNSGQNTAQIMILAINSYSTSNRIWLHCALTCYSTCCFTDRQSANFNSRYFFGGLASYGLEFLWSWAIQHIQRWLIVRPFFLVLKSTWQRKANDWKSWHTWVN